MIQTTSSTLLERSRLVRLLTDLSVTTAGAADHNLAEQLGRLISVTDSINLSRSLGQLPHSASEAIADNVDAVRDDVLLSRQKMMKSIVDSFASAPDSTGIQAPSTSTGTRIEALQTYEPYQRFYAMHQAEMAGNSHSLRLRVRAGVSGFSTELHQLAVLDVILADSLAAHNAKLFNVIPKLLERRFKQLLEAQQKNTDDVRNADPLQWLKPGGWLELFYRDMQELLLAELDLRLQPVLGLLEALNEHMSNTKV